MATVEACACGVVHLNLGPLTLRFTASSLALLQQTLAEASLRLRADADEPPGWAFLPGTSRGLA